MNPLTNMKNVKKLSEQVIHAGLKTSFHDQYRSSAWIFVGGLPYDLTEGDVVCIFSQYGEIVNINLIRDKGTGKAKGFCFICYEDQRSTDLAVDNLNGTTILKRTIRVDHVTDYKMPKDGKNTDETVKKLHEEGCAPKAMPSKPIKEEPLDQLRETLADQIQPELRLPPRLPIFAVKEEKMDDEIKVKKEKKDKKEKKKDKKRNKKKKTKKKSVSTSCSSEESEDEKQIERKASHSSKKKHKYESREENIREHKHSRVNRIRDESKRKHDEDSSGSSSSDRDKGRQLFRNKSPEKSRRRRSRSRSVEKKRYRSRSRSLSSDRNRSKYSGSSSDRNKRYHKDKSHKHR